MNVAGMLYVAVLVVFNGEENVGDQEFFDDQQDQQEFANQGKYSMGSTLMPIHLYKLLICMCLILIPVRTS